MSEGKILHGWKQIAKYFDKEIRTIQKWEVKFGLPVKRDGPLKKPRVYAFIDELEIWRKSFDTGKLGKEQQLAETTQSMHEEHSQLPLPAQRGLKRYFYLAIFLLLLIASGLGLRFFISAGNNAGQPTDFTIKGSRFIALDKQGQELWQFDTGLPNLWPENMYRERFQHTMYVPREKQPPLLIIQDVNSDGENEVLLATMTTGNVDGGTLYFLNSKGEKKWSFHGGRILKFGDTPTSGDTRLFAVQVCNLDNKGAPEIILIGFLTPYFPCYLEIFDINGNILGEFWNSGHIIDVNFFDFHGDSRKEIIVSGVNNEYREAFLAVFDSNNVWGASPQLDERYICRDFGPSSAKYYIRFPRTDVDLLKDLMELCWDVRQLKNGRFQAMMQVSVLYYEFNSKFEVEQVGASNQFQFMHRAAASEGKITSTLNEEYLENIKNGVLYYNGKEWVSKPSMANPWTD